MHQRRYNVVLMAVISFGKWISADGDPINFADVISKTILCVYCGCQPTY